MALPSVRVSHPHVEIASDGSPIVRGTRVPVRRLWAWHRRGTSIDTLFKRYPNLGPARLLDALAFAYDNQELVVADLEREREALGSDVMPPETVQTKLPFQGPPK
jgi:uncharacterized protein (DUF433 family)